jgi:transposase
MEANIVQILEEVNPSHISGIRKNILTRFAMVILSKLDFSYEYIAEIFSKTRQTVSKWANRFNLNGLAGLNDLQRSGRPKSLSCAEEKTIDDLILSKSPIENNEEQLTGKSINKIIYDKFFKVLSISYVYNLMKKLKYSYSKPRPRHQKNDVIIMLNWIRKFRREMRELKYKLDEKEILFYFQDETRYGQKTIATRIWSKTNLDNTYINQNGFLNAWIFGAINPITGDKYGLILPRLDAENMQIFLDLFAEKIADDKHVVIILDGSKAHRNGIINVSEKITLYFLPPYSPELNPIERLWQFIKKKYLSFKIYDNLDEIYERGSYSWNKITPKIVKSVCKCDYIQNLC